MNDHHDTRSDDDTFEALAREAGASLRRPAPADGVARIETSRRRRQRMRTVAGGAALAAVIAVGAAVVARQDSEPALVIEPEVTTALPTTVPPSPTAPVVVPTTTPVPTNPPTTEAPSTAPPTVPAIQDGLGDDARAWIAEEAANGYTQVEIRDGDGTAARLIVATNAAFDAHAAVLMGDGAVHPVPAEIGIQMPTQLYGVGGAPALAQLAVAGSSEVTQVWAMAPDSGEWRSTGDLGITATAGSNWGGYAVRVVDDVLIVVNNPYLQIDQNTLALSPDRRGAVVHPDLSVTTMAPAPDGVALFFTSSSGGKALQLYAPAVEGGISLEVSYDQPWQYDPVVNEWTEIPIPAWMDCARVEIASGCDWAVVPDIGATLLEVPTSHGVVALVPDGTIGLYDARTSSWTRLDDPPFELTMPTTALVGDRLVVAPWRTGANDFTTIAVLDVLSGTWTTNQIAIPPDIEARMGTEWFDVSWDLRISGSRVMAVPGPSFGRSDEEPIAVYDSTTGSWSAPTADDIADWTRQSTDLDA